MTTKQEKQQKRANQLVGGLRSFLVLDEAVAVENGEQPAETKPKPKPKPKAKAAPSNPCLCGCGGLARRGFVSSHDAKLASAFRKLALVAQGSKKAPDDAEAARLTELCEAAWASPFVNQSAYFQRLAVEAGL